MSADIASKLNADSAADAAPLFVINLCASTSPMALTHPNTPELKRYTFFVSRQREDGRERFRLHMGYFASQEEAESLLIAVRDVYPAAWAGPAPTSGMPRRARVTAVPPLVVAAPTAVAEPQPAAPVAVAPAPVPAPPAPMPAPVPAAAAKPAPVLDAMSNVRDVLAQLDDQSAPAAGKAAARAAEAKAAPAPAAATAAAPVRPQPSQAAATPVPAAVPVRAPVAPPASAVPAEVPVAKPLREVAAAASAPASTPVSVPAPVTASAPASVPAPTVSAPVATAPAAPVARASAKELDASQTLQVLEAPSASPVVSVTMDDEVAEASDVRIITPEDTQTLRDIRLDAQNNAAPCFAVQLVWAVTPIDVASLPHLAIFDAYTLYNVEGSRQGRKWYGLRLGFFSDPNSATQVAHYVRSDYQAVAVVPVAVKERDHARGGIKSAVAPRLGDAGAPQKPQDDVKLQAQGLDGFELLKDDRPRPEKRDVEDIGSRQAAAAPGAAASKLARERIAAAVNAPRPAGATPAPKGKSAAAAPAAPKATGKPTGKRVVVRKRPETPMRTAPGAPQPLESTLEILGASTLTIDESREIVNDSAVRKPIEKKQASRFSKLLNRLSGG